MLCLVLLSPKHGVSWNWAPFWLIVSFLRASPASYSHGQHLDHYFPNLANDGSDNLGAIRANQYGGMFDQTTLYIFMEWRANLFQNNASPHG
jgi:hypothetical protein